MPVLDGSLTTVHRQRSAGCSFPTAGPVPPSGCCNHQQAKPYCNRCRQAQAPKRTELSEMIDSYGYIIPPSPARAGRGRSSIRQSESGQPFLGWHTWLGWPARSMCLLNVMPEYSPFSRAANSGRPNGVSDGLGTRLRPWFNHSLAPCARRRSAMSMCPWSNAKRNGVMPM